VFDSPLAFENALLLRMVMNNIKLSKKMVDCFILISPNY